MDQWNIIWPVSAALGLTAVLWLLPKWIVCSLLVLVVSLFVILVIVLRSMAENYENKVTSLYAKQNDLITNTLLRFRTELEEIKQIRARSLRLPAVFGRLIDDGLQHLIYLTLRDFVGAWNTEQGFGGSDELVHDIKEDVWGVMQNLQERLSKVDVAKLICKDIANRVLLHFEKIRQANAFYEQMGKQPVYELAPHLSSPLAEQEYLRQMSTALILVFFSQTYSTIDPVKHLLRELLACKVLYPAIEVLTNPDFINMKLLSLIKHNIPAPQAPGARYQRPAKYEDFMKMIDNMNDIETLKLIRYDLVTDIMAAANTQNHRQERGVEPPESLQKYINKLTLTKIQCESRLQALGWMGYPVEVAMEACDDGYSVEEREDDEDVNEDEGDYMDLTEDPPAVLEVLNNPKARLYLMDYQVQIESPAYANYWVAAEQLRQAPREEWHSLGTEIFYKYICTPNRPIIISKADCKRMEEFLLGNSDISVFFDVQQEVVKTLDEKLYILFQNTDFYKTMLSFIEYNRREAEAEGQMPSTSTAEHSEQTPAPDNTNDMRRRLALMRDQIRNKAQALEALRTSLKPESKVLATLVKELETMQGDLRKLEAHLTRTDEYTEHLGQWRAFVQLAEMSEDKECPQFVLVVHHEDNQDPDSVSTGWVVLRKLQDFQELHRKLCQMSPEVKNLELPSQSLKYRLGKATVTKALEKAKVQIQKYLKFIMEDEIISHSETVYTFLIHSSDYLKICDLYQERRKFKFSLSTMFKDNGWESSSIAAALGQTVKEPVDYETSLLKDETDGSKSPADDAETIAEPLYLLLNELCRLNTKFNWIRRTIITTIQLTYNRSINRAIRVIIGDWFSEQNVFNCIQLLTNSWWQNDQLNTATTLRSQEEKDETREMAREQILNNIPMLLSNLVGQQSARLAATTIFDALQNPRLNKHIFYEIVELVLFEVCPEIKDQ